MEVATRVMEATTGQSSKTIEDTMREWILEKLIPGTKLGVSLFRAMGDRLVSLRLLNIRKATTEQGEFAKSYSPCTEGGSCNRSWHHPLEVIIPNLGRYTIYLSEPNTAAQNPRGVPRRPQGEFRVAPIPGRLLRHARRAGPSL